MTAAAAGGDLPGEGLQQGVDLLETLLGRPVILEDTEFRPLAYSRQPDDIDGARRQVILQRGVECEFLRAYQSLGISSARGPVWTPALPEWDAASRLCVPVRKGRTLLGYLWVLAPEGSLSEEQIAAAERSASFMARVFDAQHRRRRMVEQNNQLVLARLLGSDYEQTDLVASLSTAESLAPDSEVIVSAFEVPDQPAGGGDLIDMALRVKERLPQMRLPVRWMVHLGSRPGVLAVLAPAAQVAESAVAEAVQASLRSCFAAPGRTRPNPSWVDRPLRTEATAREHNETGAHTQLAIPARKIYPPQMPAAGTLGLEWEGVCHRLVFCATAAVIISLSCCRVRAVSVWVRASASSARRRSDQHKPPPSGPARNQNSGKAGHTSSIYMP